jgi:hypothetical protein
MAAANGFASLVSLCQHDKGRFSASENSAEGYPEGTQRGWGELSSGELLSGEGCFHSETGGG